MLGLIDSAKNDHYSLHKKLEFALDADSIAIQINDTSQHLETTKLIAELYLNTDNTAMAIYYYRLAASIAEKTFDNKNYGITVNNIGTIFFEKSELDSALRYYTIANEIFRLNKDSLRYAQGLVNIGMIYKNLGKYDDAFRMALTGGKVLEKLNSTQDISDAYTTLGNILILMKNYQEALFYHQKALELRESIKDSVGIAGSINNIGNVYRSNQKYIKALDYYRHALAIKERIGRKKAIATTIHNIGQVCVDLKQYSDAEVYFLKALSIREKVDDLAGLLETSLALSDLYLKTNALIKAKEYAAKVSDLLLSSGHTKQRLDQAISLVNLYRQTGQYKLASEYANVALVLKDSIFYQNMAASIAGMNAEFHLEQKEKLIQYNQYVQLLQWKQIHSQRLFISILAACVLLLVSLAVVLYYSARYRKQAKERVELLHAELNHRVKNNLQLITDMVSLQLHATKDEGQQIAVQASLDRLQAMNVIHQLLYQGKHSGLINMKELLAELIHNIQTAHQVMSGYKITTICKDVYLDIDKAIPLGLIINELLTNLFKHTDADTAEVLIDLSRKNNTTTLTVSDDCSYWNIEEAKTMNRGLGFILVGAFVEQLHGTWKTINDTKGTTHIVEFNL